MTKDDALNEARRFFGPDAVVVENHDQKHGMGRFIIGIKRVFIYPSGLSEEGYSVQGWSNESWEDALSWIKEKKLKLTQDL